MGSETSKGIPRRISMGHFGRYIRGATIDIGAGNDPMRKVIEGMSVRAWDWKDGDAQVLQGIQPQTFDTVYASHSLEDMPDVVAALKRWSEIAKIGGCLYIIVPDFMLYEHGIWPSRYNEHHRHSFSLTIPRGMMNRETHWGPDEIEALFGDAGCTLEDKAIEDWNYDYGVKDNRDQTWGKAVAQMRLVARRIR